MNKDMLTNVAATSVVQTEVRMPDWTQMPEGQMCQNCRQLPATGMWLGDGNMMSAVHGAHWWWCEKCMVEVQLESAREKAKAIPELERRLMELS